MINPQGYKLWMRRQRAIIDVQKLCNSWPLVEGFLC